MVSPDTISRDVYKRQELKDGKYDLAFSSYVEGEDELEFIPIGQEELVLITPKGHPLAEKEEIDLIDKVDYDYVYFTRNSGLRPVIDSYFSKIKRQPAIAYEGEEDSSVAGLVAAGFGIAIVPKIPLLDTMDVCIRPIISPEIEQMCIRDRSTSK